jgi:hypothetical protein
MEKALFQGIKQEIIKEIKAAENNIKIAVAWFTNIDLFDALCSKLYEQNIKITLIIIDDATNNRLGGIDFQKFIDKGGELFFSTGERTMHNKFCIIDDKILINGSYNWTYNAECKNFENIVIHYQNQQLTNNFIDQFNFIKDFTERVNYFTQNNQLNILNNSNIDYILDDCALQSELTGNKELLQKTSELKSKRNEKLYQNLTMQNFFQTKAVENTPAQPQLTSKASKQVTKSINEILDLSPEIAEFVLTSENSNWSYFRALDFDGKLLYKYAVKAGSSFDMDTKYNWSESKTETGEYLGYPVRTFEQKMTVMWSRERPAPVVETPKPTVNPAMSPELMAQFMAFMQMQQQPTAPAPKTTDRKSAPKVDEADMPF